MKRYKVVVTGTEEVVASNVKIAGELDRLIGLMFRKEMNGFDGLLIGRCNSIQTCFMRYPIDVIFLDKDDKIVKVMRNVKPWRITYPRFKARKVLELAGGSLISSISEGSSLEIVCIN